MLPDVYHISPGTSTYLDKFVFQFTRNHTIAIGRKDVSLMQISDIYFSVPHQIFVDVSHTLHNFVLRKNNFDAFDRYNLPVGTCFLWHTNCVKLFQGPLYLDNVSLRSNVNGALKVWCADVCQVILSIETFVCFSCTFYL
jgi:hypothetical protein